jgi:hypothetical protein
MKKPWQFNLRSLMLFTFKVAFLAALLRYGPIQDYFRHSERLERDMPQHIAEQVIRRQQATVPAKARLSPTEQVTSNRTGWCIVSRCKAAPSDYHYLWNLELRGTSESKIVKGLDRGGIHNQTFLEHLAEEYRRRGWELDIEVKREMPGSL